MTQPIQRPDAPIKRRSPALDPSDEVFPRWVTVFVMAAWMAVMAWAISYSSITIS